MGPFGFQCFTRILHRYSEVADNNEKQGLEKRIIANESVFSNVRVRRLNIWADEELRHSTFHVKGPGLPKMQSQLVRKLAKMRKRGAL